MTSGLGLRRNVSSRRTAHEYVLDALRTAILDGSLKPETRLVQANIANELEVSTTPVREALRDLAGEGLVRFDSHRGAVVQGVDLDECREIYELRMLVEPHALARAIPRMAPQQLERAEALYRQMGEETEPRSWVHLNRQFHATLTEGAGGKQFTEVVQRLQGASEIYVGLSLGVVSAQMTHGNHDHHQLLEAARKSDTGRAKTLLAKHLQATLDAIEVGIAQLRAED